MRILPREEKFFSYFLDQVRYIRESAQALLDGVRAGGPALAEAARKIEILENEADQVIHETLTKLNATFITPLDPEDIHTLASHLDDVIDGIEETIHRIVAYRVTPIPPPVIEVCEVLVRAGGAMQRAFEALAEGKPLLDACIEINHLEGKVDHIVRDAVAGLFQHEKDPIQLIKLKEVYEILEKTTDYCEDVADVLQEVAVKNG